ncbi:LON peptidase substrate-binding domain-containing protein [Tumebacillus sp. ITR2]|uniref:LON peptidase substrate-binding domain-containing protein n=1 Tax=Tumebacillus amylolyticus TaxID=2801339 RepID=A0ABS1JD78_9BACL|nr:LON peptidase substrate-binding domain-containing protein [Tumebacillus amylolyticus]
MSRFSLQLFPLQTVLYPYCVLPLHIFEPRYRTMIRMCVEHRVPFGIVQVTGGLALIDGHSAPRNYDVGTVAEITNVVEFQDGRLFITTQGHQRFKILESNYDEDVLTAIVEVYEDEPMTGQSYRELSEEVRHNFERYWKLLECVMNRDLGELDLPDDPNVLSWLIPSVLHVQPELKQAILQKRSTRERMEVLQDVLIEEVDKLRDAMKDGREK